MSTVNVFAGSIISKANPNLEFQTVADVGDAPTALTAAQVIGGMIIGAPTVNRILTLPTSAALVTAIPGIVVGSTIDFTVMSAANALTILLTVALGTGMTNGSIIAGVLAVAGPFTGGAAASNSGVGTFRLRCTNITAAAEAFVLYRIS